MTDKLSYVPHPLARAVIQNDYILYFNKGRSCGHVLWDSLNELGKRDNIRGLPSILSLFRHELNKSNDTGARVLEALYHMIFKSTLKSRILGVEMLSFCHNDVMVVIT